MEHGVTLHEGPSSRVLADHADVRSLHEEGAEREELAERPVDAAVAAHVLALVKQLLQLLMHREAIGFVDERVSDELHDIARYSRCLGFAARVDRAGHRGARHLRRTGLGSMRLGERLLQPILEVLLGLLVLLFGDVAASHERLGVQAAHRPLRLDEVRHQWLGHRGVVTLVVSAAAIHDQVDHDIPVEPLAVGEGDLGDSDHGLGVIAIDVEDGRLDRLCDIRRVDRGSAILRQRRETDLVVDHDMHGAAGAVGAQLRHLEGLDHDALAGEGRGTVDEDGQPRE